MTLTNNKKNVNLEQQEHYSHRDQTALFESRAWQHWQEKVRGQNMVWNYLKLVKQNGLDIFNGFTAIAKITQITFCTSLS